MNDSKNTPAWTLTCTPTENGQTLKLVNADGSETVTWGTHDEARADATRLIHEAQDRRERLACKDV